MIVSFYDKNFKGLQQNASLVVDKNSYKLTKRAVDVNTFSCTCEAFTEDIQPTFLIVKNDSGGYVYGSLAGIPVLNENNITEITGTDLKTMLSSDIIISPGTLFEYSGNSVSTYLTYVFDIWNQTSNQQSIPCELTYTDSAKTVILSDYKPSPEKAVVNAWEEIQSYLRFYNLYIDTEIDLINKKVKFTIGQSMRRNLNIKLWEYGIRNYSKWIASVNEAQGYYIDEDGIWTAGYKWILTSQNQITTSENNRDIYPIKRRIFTSEKSLKDADSQALTSLLDATFNESLSLPFTTFEPDFETKFSIYLRRGSGLYKVLPCGELNYDANGLTSFQIGYRFTGAEFI